MPRAVRERVLARARVARLPGLAADKVQDEDVLDAERLPSIADYEVDWSEQIRLETSLTMPPLPTCTRCRACADGACDLESGTKPDDLPRWATRAPLPKVDRNGPCPCGSGKKFKKCCGK